MTNEERPAALLTKAQRAYLRGERTDYSPSAERDVRQRIRTRLRASVSDISLIIKEMELKEIKKAVERDGSDWSNLVALVVVANEYLPEYGTGVQGSDPPQEPESTIRSGITTGLHRLGYTWKEVVVKIDRGDPLEELAEKDLADLSLDEIDHLLTAGLITREERAKEELRRLKMDPEAEENHQEIREEDEAGTE